MDTITSPHLLNLQFRGFIEGLTIRDKASGKELCHYFGGIPYALHSIGPFRWRRPRSLPACYRYGTRANPGRYAGKAGVCPQPGKASILFDEDCLQCNIWLPTGQAPPEGWPVYFYIHGGFLQYGSANGGNPTALISSTSFRAIIVKPAYRLNVFGFLASEELLSEDSNNSFNCVGNLGFWDQRLALEWTFKNISYFGGNPSNITVGGYSAGAHSTFYQLAYELNLPLSKRIIKRIVMHSNGPGVQPKSLSEAQSQFTELLTVLHIPLSLPPTEKLVRLRATSPKDLLNAARKMQLHEYRAVSDGIFIRPTLFQEIQDGTFARKLLASDIHILIGENNAEHFVYARHRPPTANILRAVHTRLLADYPRHLCAALLDVYFPNGKLPNGCKTWLEAFGKVYADVQIHATQRGFISSLEKAGAGHLVKRYRIEWRSVLADRSYPKDFGATHGADVVLWFWGEGRILPENEKRIFNHAFLEMFASFIKGEELQGWGASSPKEVRRLKRDGSVDIWQDEWWEKKLHVWNALMEANARETATQKAKPKL